VKTVALSAAAIGIGAAVVIGNNPVTSPKNIDDQNAVASAPGNTLPPRILSGPPPASTPSPGSTSTPPSDVTPTPAPTTTDGNNPEPSATPVFIRQTFTLDNGSIARLDQGLDKLNTNLSEFKRHVETDLLPSKAAQVDLKALGDTLGPRVDEIDKRTQGFAKGDADTLKGLNTDVSTLRTTDIPNLKNDLTAKITATKSAITGFREGTQGRSIRSRARELLGSERYQVTSESYDILNHLICGAGCSPSDAAIVTKLRALKDVSETMGKDTFRKRIGIRGGSSGRNPWEAVILRYTRVPY
jgi:hypothetical protein